MSNDAAGAARIQIMKAQLRAEAAIEPPQVLSLIHI